MLVKAVEKGHNEKKNKRWSIRNAEGRVHTASGYRLTKESGPGPLSKPYYSVQSQGLLQRKVKYTHGSEQGDWREQES